MGFFRRSRTIKGKRAPPSCKEVQLLTSVLFSFYPGNLVIHHVRLPRNIQPVKFMITTQLQYFENMASSFPVGQHHKNWFFLILFLAWCSHEVLCQLTETKGWGRASDLLHWTTGWSGANWGLCRDSLPSHPVTLMFMIWWVLIIAMTLNVCSLMCRERSSRYCERMEVSFPDQFNLIFLTGIVLCVTLIFVLSQILLDMVTLLLQYCLHFQE